MVYDCNIILVRVGFDIGEIGSSISTSTPMSHKQKGKFKVMKRMF